LALSPIRIRVRLGVEKRGSATSRVVAEPHRSIQLLPVVVTSVPFTPCTSCFQAGFETISAASRRACRLCNLDRAQCHMRIHLPRWHVTNAAMLHSLAIQILDSLASTLGVPLALCRYRRSCSELKGFTETTYSQKFERAARNIEEAI
jgi:hypothetical protein